LIRHRHFTIKGPSSPCVYLASLWRYVASNIGRTDVDTTKRRKKEKKRRREREREEKRKVEGGKEGKGEGKKEWKVKGMGTKMEKGGKGKKGEGKGKGEGKNKGEKGKEGGIKIAKCWTHRRTHVRTDNEVILFSVQCYALHWTDS